MKTNISAIVDIVLDGLEVQMQEEHKHFVKTQTIKDRVVLYFYNNLKTDDEDINYLTKLGLDQVVQSRLYNRDYRSIRPGYFVCVTTCDNEQILTVLLDNAYETLESKQKVVIRLNEVRAMKTGQAEMTFSGSEFSGYIVPRNEDEFMRDIEAYAI